MSQNKMATVTTEAHLLTSKYLLREVKVDCYLPASLSNLSNLSLLLINDGQDLRTMHFEEILDDLYAQQSIEPLFCVGIHCSADRKNEYGTAKILDYKGRGAKAALYQRFVLEELLPFLRKQYHIDSFTHKAFAGFSLGGLSALDIVWNNPKEFSVAAVFSGSLWWRTKDQQDPDFDEEADLIMHQQVKLGKYRPWLKFFFQVGTMDEKADRNGNGIIDAIDDTLQLMTALEKKGYNKKSDMRYLELKDGKHDVPTWARALPVFLQWAWGTKK